MAPEIMANAPYAPAADVWSFGGVVLQMATGHFPWLEVKRASTADLFASAELHDFLGAIFDRDADRRPAAAALLRHAFLEEPDDADELNSSFTELEAHHEVFAKIERIAKESDAPRPARSRRRPAIRVDGADEAKRAEPSPYGRSSASDAASVATTPDALDATLKGAAAAAVKAALDELAPSTPSTLATPSPVDDASNRRAVFKMPAWQKTTAETDRHDTVYLAPRVARAAADGAARALQRRRGRAAESPNAAAGRAARGRAAAAGDGHGGRAAGQRRRRAPVCKSTSALYFAQFLKNKSKRPDSREAPTSSRSLGDARPADPGAPPPSSRSLDGH
ncbi:MAP kinase kinase kinase [Aureococcus anophagefferens]|nr:MAP kinase kinase kinase [Aureococcus anophagefferens]